MVAKTGCMTISGRCDMSKRYAYRGQIYNRRTAAVVHETHIYSGPEIDVWTMFRLLQILLFDPRDPMNDNPITDDGRKRFSIADYAPRVLQITLPDKEQQNDR